MTILFCPCVICAPHIWPHLASVEVVFLHFNSQAKGSERSNMIFFAWTLCSWWLCYTIAPIQYQLLRFNIDCSNSISFTPIHYETRFPSKHHRPHLIQVLADQLRSVTKARAQYEIIPLIEIRILRLIDPKISKLVFFTNHQNHRITPQLATVGEKKETMPIYAFRVHAA